MESVKPVDEFDLAIVGSGIIGAFAAYSVRKMRPDLRVVLLDQSLVGSGATYYSGGHMHPHGSSDRQRELVARSIERYRELASAVPQCRFQPVPLFGIVHRDRAAETLGGYVGQTVRYADDHDRRRLAAFFPSLRIGSDQVLLAGCISEYATPSAVTQAIIGTLRGQSRFSCWESVPVTRVERLSSGFRLWSHRPLCTTRQVVCCTGPWLLVGPHPAALPPLDARVKKVAAMHIDIRPQPDSPILYLFDDDVYLLPLHARGHWVLSFTSQEWDCAPDALRLRLTDKDEAIASELLRRYVPELLSHCRGGRVFCDLYTPDRLPLACPLPGLPDYVLAGGGSGFGFRLAPAIAEDALGRLPRFLPATPAAGRSDGDDPKNAGERVAADAPRAVESRRRRVLLTATPPTPNGDLHIGHLSGPYLAADACNRYLRLRGMDAKFITGIDEHQSYVALKALKVGCTPDEAARHYGELMASTWAKALVEPDHVAWPRRSPRHIALVREFCRSLFDRGFLVARTTLSLHCDICDRYLFEAWVHGGCPHCGEPSGGNACEACGRPNDCADLIDPRCTVCGSPPAVRQTTRLYFLLSRLESRLREHCAAASMSAHLRSMCDRMLDAGLPDICVSHFSDWGIGVPVAGFELQKLYVWFEMAPGYLAATAELAGPSAPEDAWVTYWAAEDAEIVQFFGFDNGYFHALLFPALLIAYSASIRPPATFVVNEFYQLDHSKISTSRNHAIWGSEFLPRVTADVARYYLGFSAPEREQTNFTLEEFGRVVHAELHEILGTWLVECAHLLRRLHVRHPPRPSAWTDEQRIFLERLRELERACVDAYEPRSFSLQRAARQIGELARLGRQFGRSQAHLVGCPGRECELQTSAALSLLALKLAALAAWPLMPALAARLWQELGHLHPIAEARWSPPVDWLSAAHELSFADGTYFATSASASA